MTKIRSISLILVALMMLSMLAACQPAGNVIPNVSDSDGTPAPEETPEPIKDPLSLTSGNKCKYTVVRPENCSDSVKDLAVSVRNAISEHIGGFVSIKEDFLVGNSKPEQYEILIGQTNREESVETLAGLKYNDYCISIEGDKLVVNAYNDEKLTEAVNKLIELINGSEGDILFTSEDQVFFKAEYEMDEIKIGDVSLKGYSIVISSSAPHVIKTYAANLQRCIAELCGEYMPIKTDLAEETEKELILGRTKREASQNTGVEELGKYGYVVCIKGSKVVLTATDNGFAFMKLMEHVTDGIEGAELLEGSATLELSETPILTSFCITDAHNHLAMLEPPYYLRGNLLLAIDTMLATTGQVDVVVVGGDHITGYPSSTESGCLPYEYFVGYRKYTMETIGKLGKGGKVIYTAGNHDYSVGEAATDGPGINGSYNSFDFYFGEDSMKDGMGVLPEEDMFVKIGEHTGEKYLMCYYYEVNGIGFAGLAPDPDLIWSKQGQGFSEESLDWLEKKLDEEDPTGDKVIFVNCHYPIDNRYYSEEKGMYLHHSNYCENALEPVFIGHRNLFQLFGHWESWMSDYTVKNVLHYDTKGNLIEIEGDETDSDDLNLTLSKRGYNAVYMGHIRPMYSDYKDWFEKSDALWGDGGTGKWQHFPSTGTPKVGQCMYIEVFEDRVVFTMKNFGTIEGFSTDDLIVPYTVYLYK